MLHKYSNYCGKNFKFFITPKGGGFKLKLIAGSHPKDKCSAGRILMKKRFAGHKLLEKLRKLAKFDKKNYTMSIFEMFAGHINASGWPRV